MEQQQEMLKSLTANMPYGTFKNENESLHTTLLLQRLKNAKSIFDDALQIAKEDRDFKNIEAIRQNYNDDESIITDISLYSLDLDSNEFPEYVIPTHDLAIREEGYIPTASLVRLVGAIQNVKVKRPTIEKAGTADEKLSSRTRVWDEIKHYSLDEETCKEKFSKSFIKLYLLLHMLPVDNNGNGYDVSIKKVSEYLGISMRTTKDNLKKLAEYNFINLDTERKKHFDFTLIGYAEKAEKGKGGYLKFSKFTFDTFLRIQDVNALRLGLRIYERSIETLAQNKGRIYAPKFVMDEIKSILPAYTVYPKAIKEMLSLLTDLVCKQDIIEDELYFVLDTTQNPRHHQTEVVEKTVNETVVALLNHEITSFDKVDKADLLQLTNQYGITKTIYNIEKLVKNENHIKLVNDKEVSFGTILRGYLDKNKFSIITIDNPFQN